MGGSQGGGKYAHSRRRKKHQGDAAAYFRLFFYCEQGIRAD